MGAVSFVGGGDLMIDRPDPASILRHVENDMREADVTYVNLEGPACDVGEKNPALVGIARPTKSCPGAIDALVHAEVDVVSLANNHTMDYGKEGLFQTLELLDAARIPYTGAGRNIAEARKPALLETGGIKIAMLSYTSVCMPPYVATNDQAGAAVIRVKTTYEANLRLLLQPGSPMATRTVGHPDDVEMLVGDIRAARKSADIVLVSWHWGISERWGKIADYQRTLGRAAIDAGANAILGHHAHMLLGIEFYKHCPIFYSMGNFAFDMSHHYFRPESMLLKCDLSRDGADNWRILPLTTNDAHEPVPVPADGEGRKVCWILEDHSDGMNTRFTTMGREIGIAQAG